VRASIAQRLQQQPPNSFLVGNTMLRQDDRSEGLFKQNPVGRPYPADHVVSLWMRRSASWTRPLGEFIRDELIDKGLFAGSTSCPDPSSDRGLVCSLPSIRDDH
jgi:hypothetical protein